MSQGSAHKPITSPFTYNDDVFPILKDRCSRCHVPDGVAPMSLMTYDDTVPWGESIRVELLAGHMPPWGVDAAPTRFRNAQTLTAREMNVLLTWATGGTPFGTPDKTPPPVSYERRWPLGTPDLELSLPNEFTRRRQQAGGHRRVRHPDRLHGATMAACSGSAAGNSGNRAIRNCADQISGTE